MLHPSAGALDSYPHTPSPSILSLHSPSYSSSLHVPAPSSDVVSSVTSSGYQSCSQPRPPLWNTTEVYSQLDTDSRSTCGLLNDSNKDKHFQPRPRWKDLHSDSEDLSSGCKDLAGATRPEIRDSAYLSSRYGGFLSALPTLASQNSDPQFHVFDISSDHPDRRFVSYQPVCSRTVCPFSYCHGHKKLPSTCSALLTQTLLTLPVSVSSGKDLLLPPPPTTARRAALDNQCVPPPDLPSYQSALGLMPNLSQHLRGIDMPRHNPGTNVPTMHEVEEDKKRDMNFVHLPLRVKRVEPRQHRTTCLAELSRAIHLSTGKLTYTFTTLVWNFDSYLIFY